VTRKSLSGFGALGRAALVFILGATCLLAPESARAADPPRVEWSPEWPKFRPAELAFTSGLSLQVAEALFLYPKPRRNWEGGIVFDDAARNVLRLRTRHERETASMASDILYYTLATYPLVVDAGIVAAGVHGSSEVAVELLAMDLEAYALTGAIALTAEKIGRVRPEDRGCQGNPGYSKNCGNDAKLNTSFLSGHTTIAFTGAGLICAHHQHLPLYGGGAPDAAACVAALTAASAAGALRIMADKHYSTDVLLGVGVGLLGGYGLPTLLHYGSSSGHGGHSAAHSLLPTFTGPDSGVAAVVAPAIAPGFAGLTLVGTF